MADKLTILMPNLPGDLVDENGKVYDYDGIVYRADEVNALYTFLQCYAMVSTRDYRGACA